MAQISNPFQQMGIDMRDEEQILADRAQELREQALAPEDRPERFAGESDLRRVGKMLGTEIGLRTGGPKLSPSEMRQVDAMNTARVRFDREVEQSGKKLSAREKAWEQQRIMGEELLRVGDSRGFQLIEAASQQKDTAKKGELEREGMGLRNRVSEQQLTLNDMKLKRGESYKVFKRNDPDPTNGFVAYMQPDGTFKDSQGNVYDSNELTMYQPPDPKAGRGGRPLTPGDWGISDREAGMLRAQAAATTKLMRGAVRMKEAIKDNVGETGSVTIMDGTGKATNAVVKTIDFLQGAARVVESALNPGAANQIITDGEYAGKPLDNASNARSYAVQNFNVLDDMLHNEDGTWKEFVPENIRSSARARTEYYATLTQMVYAKARTNEPGARQLSDADFKNAMVGMAGATADPEAFRRVTYGNVMEDVRDLNGRLLSLPGPVRDGYMVISKPGWDAFNEERKRFEEEFAPDAPWGTAENPSAVLTGEDEELGLSPEKPIVLE